MLLHPPLSPFTPLHPHFSSSSKAPQNCKESQKVSKMVVAEIRLNIQVMDISERQFSIIQTDT